MNSIGRGWDTSQYVPDGFITQSPVTVGVCSVSFAVSSSVAFPVSSPQLRRRRIARCSVPTCHRFLHHRRSVLVGCYPAVPSLITFVFIPVVLRALLRLMLMATHHTDLPLALRRMRTLTVGVATRHGVPVHRPDARTVLDGAQLADHPTSRVSCIRSMQWHVRNDSCHTIVSAGISGDIWLLFAS